MSEWKNATGLTRVINATGYSMKGLAAAYQNEAAFRQEFWLFMVLAPLGLWLGDNAIERVLLVGSVTLVLIVELLNTAVESVVDRIGTEKHQLSGQAKDQGSAAVLISLGLVIFTWLMILLDL